jgi:glycosyltransferase involved in cell wall biosynthesis
MRIGINCLNVSPNYFGGSNSYTFGLINGFFSKKESSPFQLYVTPENKHLFNDYKNNPNVKIIILNFKLSFIKKLIQFISLLLSYFFYAPLYQKSTDYFYKHIRNVISTESDLIYIPTTKLLPFKYNIPSVLSMHDIQHVHFPKFFTIKELISRKVLFYLSAKYATYLQASTTFIKEDLLKHFSFLSEHQVFVISEGVNISKFSSANNLIPTQNKYKLPKRFIYYPAQLWHHKNHETILRGLDYLKRELNLEIPLILTGSKSSSASKIFKLIDSLNLKKVTYLGVVPFEDLIDLYHLSTLIISAAIYESSSLPILEACASGTAVIASDSPSNLETSQNFSLNLFKTKDSVDFAKKLHFLYSNPKTLEKQISHNLVTIQNQSWNIIAQNYLKLFNTICNKTN